MKKLIFFPAIVAILFFLSFSPPATWIRYVSKEGHYSIEFPGRATEIVKNDTSETGKTTLTHYATWFPNDSEGYMATWTDLRKNYPKSKTMKEMLEESRDGAMRTIHAANVITTATILDKDPYIAFAFTSTEFAGRGRIYIINKFQYSVITLFSRSAGISPDADKFIRSFRHSP